RRHHGAACDAPGRHHGARASGVEGAALVPGERVAQALKAVLACADAAGHGTSAPPWRLEGGKAARGRGRRGRVSGALAGTRGPGRTGASAWWRGAGPGHGRPATWGPSTGTACGEVAARRGRYGGSGIDAHEFPRDPEAFEQPARGLPGDVQA